MGSSHAYRRRCGLLGVAALLAGCGGAGKGADGSAPAIDTAIETSSSEGGSADAVLDQMAAETTSPSDAPVDTSSVPDASGDVNRKFPGGSCGSPDDCLSGFCEQGVCCQTACAGVCRSCAQTSSLGVCMPFAAGQDPLNQCDVQGQTTCGLDGTCDGFGACRYYASGTVCAAPGCSGATFSSMRACDGRGACAAAATATCMSAMTCTTSGCVDVRVNCAGSTNATNDPLINGLFNVSNYGSVPTAYADIKLRYWFTEEGSQAQVTTVLYAVIGMGNVLTSIAPVTPARTGANSYLEVGFASAAGTLAAFGMSGDIQTMVHKDDYSVYDETDDYSYPPSTIPSPCPKVTLYYKGTLMWGTEP